MSEPLLADRAEHAADVLARVNVSGLRSVCVSADRLVSPASVTSECVHAGEFAEPRQRCANDDAVGTRVTMSAAISMRY
jgi:hypothetical protein